MLGYAIFRLLSVSETFLSLFVHSMLILCFNTQCLYSEHVLGGGSPSPRPPPPGALVNAYVLCLFNQCLYYTMKV
jgi:hypothetical protein